MSHHRFGDDAIVRTTVFVKIPVTIEIEVRVPADGGDPGIDDFEWGDRVIEVDHHWTYDDYVCEQVEEACRAAVAAHRRTATETP